MNRLPKIFGSCPAGCSWETIHREEFLRSASHVEVHFNEDGYWHLEIGKTYKIFADKDADGRFYFSLTIDYIAGIGPATHSIGTVTNDKYANYFVFTLLEYSNNDNGGLTLVYEIEGNRYSEDIPYAGVSAGDDYIKLWGANSVLLYNADATVYARDGKDGKDGKDGAGVPPITAEDNGKFLMVVDGAIATVALQDVSVEGL